MIPQTTVEEKYHAKKERREGDPHPEIIPAGASSKAHL